MDIVVGTPGRLEDLTSTGKLALHQCRLFDTFLQVDIVVGTPGRLEDLISTGKLALHQCRLFDVFTG